MKATSAAGRGRASDARRARERERHEQEVLEAAERVFARHGFHGASMAEIAREAEFSVGTLYNLFGSKEALFERLLLQHVAALHESVKQALAKSEGLRERLVEVALAKARFSARQRAFLAIFASSSPGLFRTQGFEIPSVLAAHARMRSKILEAFVQGSRRGELREDLSPEVAALLFEAATRAHCLERVIKSEGEVDEAEVRAVVSALLDGLACGRPGA